MTIKPRSDSLSVVIRVCIISVIALLCCSGHKYSSPRVPAWFGGVLVALSLLAFMSRYTTLSDLLSFRATMREPVMGRQPELELRDGKLVSCIPGQSEGRSLPVAIHDLVRDERICFN